MELSFSCNDGKLTIKMPLRVDTGNITEVKEAIDKVLAKVTDFDDLILDCENLTYISSVGLRLMLTLRKSHSNFLLTKVNQTVFEIFDMTGFASILDIERA